MSRINSPVKKSVYEDNDELKHAKTRLLEKLSDQNEVQKIMSVLSKHLNTVGQPIIVERRKTINER